MFWMIGQMCKDKDKEVHLFANCLILACLVPPRSNVFSHRQWPRIFYVSPGWVHVKYRRHRQNTKTPVVTVNVLHAWWHYSHQCKDECKTMQRRMQRQCKENTIIMQYKYKTLQKHKKHQLSSMFFTLDWHNSYLWGQKKAELTKFVNWVKWFTNWYSPPFMILCRGWALSLLNSNFFIIFLTFEHSHCPIIARQSKNQRSTITSIQMQNSIPTNTKPTSREILLNISTLR